MKVVLYETKGRRSRAVYKDFAGNLGAGFCVGESLPARFLERMKRWGIHLPLPVFGYLAAILERRGHGVSYMTEGLPEGADLVLVQSSLADWREELETARRIKRSTPGTAVGFIGPLAALKAQDCLASGADFVVAHEPEALIDGLAKGAPLPRGLVQSPPVQDLDSLPFPDWGIYRGRGTFRYFPALKVAPVFPVLSSRGCAYKCGYCPYISHFDAFRSRSPENVVEEIERLVRDHGARGILFRDPLFSFPMDRAEAIGRLLIKRKVEIRFACETRVDCLGPELIDVLHEAGLRSINVGIESVNEAALLAAKRGKITGEQQKSVVSYCDQKGINVTAFYILGFPEDTPSDVEATARYARELNTHIASFTIFTPLPGVRAEADLKDEVLTADYSLYDSYHLVYKHPRFEPAVLESLRQKAYVDYYFRPRYVADFVRRMLR